MLVLGAALLAAAALVWSANLRRSTFTYWVVDVVSFFPQTWLWWFLQVRAIADIDAFCGFR